MRRLALGLSLLVLALVLNPGVVAQFPALTSLEALRKQAEGGDATAQLRLGEAYSAYSDYSSAVEWFQKAAAQGNLDACWHLGELFLNIKLMHLPDGKPVPPKPVEGIKWLSTAANLDHRNAQRDLGRCFADGWGIKKDQVEAFKWFKLASRGDPFSGISSLDKLVLKLTPQEIAEGERRVKAFQAGIRPPVDPLDGKLVLKGISGTADNRLALINNKTVGKGNSVDIQVANQTVHIECLEIRSNSVVIKVDGESTARELRLSPN